MPENHKTLGVQMGKTEEDKIQKVNDSKRKLLHLKSSVKAKDIKSSNTSNVIKGKAFEDRAVPFLDTMPPLRALLLFVCSEFVT